MAKKKKHSAVSKKYTMQISRLTLDKLGIKLYDKVSAVLAELIANAYDADAQTVQIALPLNTYLATESGGKLTDAGYEIRIDDDGHGMTAEEVNDFYLKVGSNRRLRPQGGVSLEFERPVMGRKGIGKLAPFGICREIEVISAGGDTEDEEFEVAHLILKYDDMVGEDFENYHPVVGDQDGDLVDERGTTIILRDFVRRMVPKKETLFRQLTSRFGLERDDWSVSVEDLSDDADGFELSGDELEVVTMDGTRIELDDRPVELPDGRKLQVKGWVGYAKDPYKDEVMAGVRIYSRGKIVSQTRDFNVPSGFTGEFKMRSYITGYVQAEWLDGDDEDLVRSDRQDIIWNCEKGMALQAWGQTLVKEVANRSETSVNNKTWDEFLDRSDIEKKAEQAFPNQKDVQKSVIQAAKMVIKGTDREMVLKSPDWVGRVVAFAISVAPHRSLLDGLREASADASMTLGSVVDLFSKVQIAEIYSLGQVARERMAALEKLESNIYEGTTEQPLQSLIETAPWILMPEWTPISMDRKLSTLRKSFEAWYKQTHGEEIVTSSIENPTKEPDFVCLGHKGQILIVEIKKPDYKMTDKEFSRALGYLSAVETFLESNTDIGAEFPNGVLLIIISDKMNLKEEGHKLALRNSTNMVLRGI